MRPRELIDAVVRAAAAVEALVIPVECPGCEREDLSWCATCANLLAGAPVRREQDAPRLDRLDAAGPMPVWAPASYAGAVREIIVAWKDRGRADLDPLVGAALDRVGMVLAEDLLAARTGPIVVVPAPSTRAATRARGRYVVGGLAEGVADGLRRAGCVAQIAAPLVRRGVGTQVGRGLRGRGARLDGVVLRRRLLPRGALCLLVDDVLTTGATLAACENALVSGGARVLGAVVLAATPPPRRSLSDSGSDTPSVEVPGAR